MLSIFLVNRIIMIQNFGLKYFGTKILTNNIKIFSLKQIWKKINKKWYKVIKIKLKLIYILRQIYSIKFLKIIYKKLKI